MIYSCKKEENKPEETPETPTTKSCQLLNRQTDAGMVYKSYEYDSQGRLTKIQDYNSGVLDPTDFQTFEYSSTEVNTYDENHILLAKWLINSNGYATTEYAYLDNDTTYFEYNSDGYLVKETTHTGGSSHTIERKDYTISGGNVIKEERFENDSLYETIDFEYYSDKLSKSQIGSNYQLGSIYLKGVKNKNLTKKITYTSTFSSVDIDEYVYELNENGYVTRVSQTNNGSSTPNVWRYSYTCN